LLSGDINFDIFRETNVHCRFALNTDLMMIANFGFSFADSSLKHIREFMAKVGL